MDRAIVLELGIGKGGPHILLDGPRVQRIGVDIHEEELKLAVKYYCVEKRVIDLGKDSTRLDIPNNLVTHTDMLFPYGGLLYALTGANNLWDEINRITRPGGSFRAVVDTHDEGFRWTDYNGDAVVIYNAHLKIAERARRIGFVTIISQLQEAEIRVMGTQTAANLIEIMRERPNTFSVWELYGRKLSLPSGQRSLKGIMH